MNYGLKISEPGYDVKSAEEKNLAFASHKNQFKIHAQGSFTVTVESGDAVGSTTITHSLGYVPACLVYLEQFAGTGNRLRVPYRETQRMYMADGLTTLIISVEYAAGSEPIIDKVHAGYYFIFKDNVT